MAGEKKEAATPTSKPTPGDVETAPPTENVEEVKTEAVPEGTPEKLAVESDMEAFLADEADDLDADATPAEAKTEETPPEGPTPKEEAKEETPKVEATPEAAAAPPPAEPKPGEVPPTATPPEVVVPAPTPPAAPVAAPAEPAPPSPALPAEPTPPTMDEVRATYQENRKALEKQIAENVYNLTEDQVQRLDDGDASVIPEFGARVYMDAVTGSVAHMITYLPQMIQEVLAGRDAHQEWTDKFYTANPALDKAAHGAVVDRLGASYRGMYPQATPDEFIRDVGAQAMVALKVLPGNGQGALAPVVPVVAPVPKVPPFSPASAGGGGGAAAPGSLNPFEALSEAMDPAEELNVD